MLHQHPFAVAGGDASPSSVTVVSPVSPPAAEDVVSPSLLTFPPTGREQVSSTWTRARQRVNGRSTTTWTPSTPHMDLSAGEPSPAQQRISPSTTDYGPPVFLAPSVPQQGQNNDPREESPDCRPVSPVSPTPAAPRLRPHILPPARDRAETEAPPPVAQRGNRSPVYNLRDPTIFWLNDRPYRFHKRVGEGGFGSVCQVEMLIPPGTEVIRTATGSLQMDEEGFALRPAANTSAPSRPVREPPQAAPPNIAPRGPADGAQQAQEQFVDVSPRTQQDAEMLQLLSKASMGPPQELVSFVLAGGDVDNTKNLPRREDFRRVGANENGHFNVEDVTLVQGSGAFFALKVQKAKNKQQLEESAGEAESLLQLKGCPFIVQIVDHAVNEQSLLLLILMELGACDLHFLFRQKSDLSIPEICRIWQGLVRSVDAAHEQGIMHRDIKPQNFLLVPVTPFADRVLATTAVPREKFVFHFGGDDVGSSGDAAGDREGSTVEDYRNHDITLTLRDPSTGNEDVLRLRIKLSDFGLAQPLEDDESHLSVKGCCGTILYMAPETLRPTNADGVKKVSMDVDVWALGVVLFQMLHNNRTPFDAHYRADGRVGVAVAASNKEIHRGVMVFERAAAKVWIAERKKALRRSGSVAAGPGVIASGSPLARKEANARVLLEVWMQMDFLFRMCELCLAFDASDRVVARDLKRWTGIVFDKNWCKDYEVCAQAEGSYAKLVDSLNVLSIVGSTIARAAFPEVWAPNLINDVTANPTHVTANPTHVVMTEQSPTHVAANPTHVAMPKPMAEQSPTHVTANPTHVVANPNPTHDVMTEQSPTHVAANPTHVAMAEAEQSPTHVAANPTHGHVAANPTHAEQSGRTNVAANPTHVVVMERERADLERAKADPQPSGEDEQDGASVSFRCKVFGIILLVLLGAVGLLAASIGIIRASEDYNPQEYPTEPQESVRPTVVPGTAVPDIPPPEQPVEELVPVGKAPSPFMVSCEGMRLCVDIRTRRRCARSRCMHNQNHGRLLKWDSVGKELWKVVGWGVVTLY